MKKILKKLIKIIILSTPVINFTLFAWYYLELKLKEKRFVYSGRELQYFIHTYNNLFPWGFSERSIEIPIVLHLLKQDSARSTAGKILEIGNVTKHYYDSFKTIDRVVVDKYEKAYDILNIDIADYHVEDKFNFIYSISTFEHMDSDGGRNDAWSKDRLSAEYSSVAFMNIKHVVQNLLAENGIFVVTVPIGYMNCEIDKSIFEAEYDNLPLEVKITAYKRLGQLEWKQVQLRELHGFKEDERLPGRQALVVLEFKK